MKDGMLRGSGQIKDLFRHSSDNFYILLAKNTRFNKIQKSQQVLCFVQGSGEGRRIMLYFNNHTVINPFRTAKKIAQNFMKFK